MRTASAQGIFSSPDRSALQLVDSQLAALVQPLEVCHVLLKQFEVCDVEVVVEMIDFLSLGDHCDTPTDLVVENNLMNRLGVFVCDLLEDGLCHKVNLIA